MELYTKRQFRCDCGVSEVKIKCKLDPVKSENIDNAYNQNFFGLYCTCKKPYPDPEDTIEDCMIQCVVCEDWYHGRHTNNDETDNEKKQSPPDERYKFSNKLNYKVFIYSSFLQHLCRNDMRRLCG